MQLPLYCSVHFPAWQLQVAEAVRPELSRIPYALVEQIGGSPLARVLALGRRSLADHVPEQVRVGELNARWPQVEQVIPDPSAAQSLIEQLLLLAESQTPTHAFEHDTLLLDLTGMQRILGSDPHTFVRKLRHRIRSTTGLLRMRIAMSDSRCTALLLARSPNSPAFFLCPSGTEQASLSVVAISAVPDLSPRSLQRLQASNLNWLGELQRLDRAFFLEHIGPEGERLYAMSRGLDLRSTAHNSLLSLRAEHVFPTDTNHAESICHAIHELSDELGFRLRSKGRLTRELQLTVVHSDGTAPSFHCELPGGTDVFSVLRKAALQMNEQASACRLAVRTLRLEAKRLLEGRPQMDLFSMSNDSKQLALQAKMDKTRAKHGFRSVGNGVSVGLARQGAS